MSGRDSQLHRDHSDAALIDSTYQGSFKGVSIGGWKEFVDELRKVSAGRNLYLDGRAVGFSLLV